MHSFNFPTTSPWDVSRRCQLMQWKNAPDLQTLFELNRAYIKGELDVHPAHPRKLYDETLGVLKGLLRLNEYGMFTIQGQPRMEIGCVQNPHTHENDEEKPVLDDTDALCRCCAVGCLASPNCSQYTAQRWLPFVQFCLPVGPESGVSRVEAVDFARRLLNHAHLHAQVSWPIGLPLTETVYKSMRWSLADLTEAEKYIPQADLDLYYHFKSAHGTSSAHEVKSAATYLGLNEAEWSMTGGWSEVNDYHLLRPRVPEFFLEQTLIIGVNSTSFDAVEDLEALLLSIAKQCGLERCFPDLDNETFEDTAEYLDAADYPEDVEMYHDYVEDIAKQYDLQRCFSDPTLERCFPSLDNETIIDAAEYLDAAEYIEDVESYHDCVEYQLIDG